MGKGKDPGEIIRLALAAYNASSRVVRDGRLPSEGPIAAYVRRVMENYDLLIEEGRVENDRRPPAPVEAGDA